MHDLDRAMFEAGNEAEYGYGSAQLEQEEFLNVLGEVLGESDGAPRGGLQRRAPGAAARSSAQEETEEMELALELLQVSNEEELGAFFGNLVKRATGVASKAVKNVAPHLTDIAKTLAFSGAVPAGLQTLATAAGGGEKGGEWAKRVGQAGGSLLGWEMEGLSQEDREFETARTMVRWAKDAAERAAEMTPKLAPRPSAAGGPVRQVPPGQIAKAAAVLAAQRVAPGLVPIVRQIPVPGTPVRDPGGAEDSGRWVRRGNTVVLHGFSAG